MKKIVTALTMGALVAGSAFADFTVNANYRQRATLYANYEGNVGGKDFGYLDAYQGNGTDNLTMKMKGDIVTFDFMAVTDQKTTNKIRFKNVDAEVKLGPVTLFGGIVADGKSNGAYRVKNDCDAGAFEGTDFEYKKLGSIYAKSPSLFVDNPLQNVAGAGENLAASLKYSLDADFGKLDLSGWYISNESSSTELKVNKTPTTWSNHTLSFLADASLGFGKVEAIVKVGDYSKKKEWDSDAEAKTEEATAVAFGAYIQPQLPVPGLTLTVGGNGSLIAGAFTDWGVDLRARYATGPLSISSFNAISGLTDDGVVRLYATKDGLLTSTATKGIAFAPYYDKNGNLIINDAGKDAGTAPASTTIMSNNLLVRYAINERFAVTGIFADMISMGNAQAIKTDTDGSTVVDSDNNKWNTQIDLRFSAWLQIYAAKKAYVNIGLVESISNVNKANNTGIDDADIKPYHVFAIPVIFRVQM